MYGAADLKDTLKVTETTVECPVKGCRHSVPRQRKTFRRSSDFRCPDHSIFISPSTFEYENKLDNILWKSELDQDLLFNKIFKVKRETERIARDNSEDAVTWNVFRFLEKQNLLEGFLSDLTGFPVDDCEIIYWSYCQSEKQCWSWLQQVRNDFEINPSKGSEPDLIVKSSNSLFFIEAKLNANNNTVPSSSDLAVRQKYENGCQRWFDKVFKSDFHDIAVVNKKYELLRFWLLGSKIADSLHSNFFLINLVPQEKEKYVESAFRSLIKETENRRFRRITWEEVYGYFLNVSVESKDKETLLKYFSEKIVGYNRENRLQKAFMLE